MRRVFLYGLIGLLLTTLPPAGGTGTYRAPWPWNAIADCETGGDSTPGRAPYRARWSYNGRSGFDGGLQFHPSTWRAAKTPVRAARAYAYAWQAPPWVQVAVARSWLRRTSWSQWPVCSRKAGVA